MFWVKPFVVLAYLSRTSASLLDHGENKLASWSPDGNRIVIEVQCSYAVLLVCLDIILKTVDSHLVLVVVEYSSNATSYRTPRLSAVAQRQFLPGPGEGSSIQSISLQFEGVIRIDGVILRCAQVNSVTVLHTDSWSSAYHRGGTIYFFRRGVRQLFNVFHGHHMTMTMKQMTPE